MRVGRAAVVTAVFVISACGGGGDGSVAVDSTAPNTTTAETTESSTSVETTTAAPSAVGMASPVEQGVTARLGTSTDFSTIEAATEVQVGDLVATDDTGYGQIEYPDGSLTRLDVNTEFEVVELAESAGVSTTRTKLSTGRVWNRVSDLGEEGEFSVETSVAVATVQGTAFMVDCRAPSSCVFTVLEGSIELTLSDGTTIVLVAPSSVKIDATDGAGPIAKVPADGAFGDPWAVDNATRDVTAGFVSSAEMYQVHGPAFGSLDGTLAGDRTVVDFICISTSTCAGDDSVGDVAPRTYEFSIDCAAGYPCAGQVLTEYTVAGVVNQQVVLLRFDGTTYSWTLTYDSFQCTWDDNNDGAIDRTSGALKVQSDWKLIPTTAAIIDGVWTITAGRIDAVTINTVTANDPACDPVNVRDSRQVIVAQVAR